MGVAQAALSASESSFIECRPFVKWVGGKGQLLPELRSRFPETFRCYYEPFVGGGAVLFSLQPRSAYISDVNPELINAYKVIRDDVESLLRHLRQHRYEKDYFYAIRDIDRTSDYAKWSDARKAARLIYLNKTCYNGLYRVNSRGHFNTPFGRYSNPKFVDPENLRACAQVLQRVQIELANFEAIEALITTEDFVYLDPPYVPLSATANFTGYSKDGFDFEMQEKLYSLCMRLDKKGVRWLQSNSSADWVIQKYKSFKLDLVSATRAINSKGAKRGKIHEVLIRNY